MIPPFVPSLAEASREIAAAHLSPLELVECALARIQALDPSLLAFIEVTADRARSAARKAEQKIHDGTPRGLLHGIPYGLKDLYDAARLRTTCNSRVLLQNMAVTDSDTAARLDGAGILLMGKLSTHDSPPAPPARNCHSPAPATLGTLNNSPAAHPPAPGPPLHPTCCRWPWAPIPEVPFACLPLIQGLLGSNRPMGG